MDADDGFEIASARFRLAGGASAVTPVAGLIYAAAMFGRFTQQLSWEELHRLADLISRPRNLAPRLNIAPTTRIEVLRPSDGGGVELLPMRWGLTPGWWKKPLNELPATFNARAETVAQKPMFRSAFKSRRCIIPATGFYEWTGKAGAKTPHYFSAALGEPLAFAALWEQAKHPKTGEPLTSATIIVGAPSARWSAAGSTLSKRINSANLTLELGSSCESPFLSRDHAGVGRGHPIAEGIDYLRRSPTLILF